MTSTILNPETIDLEVHRRRAWSLAALAWRTRLRLPPRLTLSEWADRHRVLSAESSAEPGPWRTERVPYLREIMDTISGSEYQDITVLKCSQSGGTEAINNAVGYYIDQEPSPMLVIQPNVKPMAEAWSKDRLAPMLRDCPRLRGKVRDPRARDSGNTVLHKTFPGGYITVMGANSPAGLASRPIRIVLADELDRWAASAGTEGDPLSLAEARTTTFRHRKKIVKVTTLGNEGESRGEKAWKLSDQRHFYVPCPHCGHRQPLEWRDTKGNPDIRAGKGVFRLVWEKTVVEGVEVHHPETAAYQCRACEALIRETDKPATLAQGQWVKHNPESRKAGFHIAGLLSAWVRWREVAAGWLEKHEDPEQRKTFINTVVGLLYQEAGEVPDTKRLSGRREVYGAEVPAGVGALTLAVDVQGDRLEAEVRGWGADEESWQIRLERFYGDPNDADTWANVEALRLRSWTHESGQAMRIRATMVDSGYLTDVVYRWVRPRQTARVFAYKGSDTVSSPLSRASKANADGVKVFTVNPTHFKDVLFRRLKRPSPGPGYLHFGLAEETGGDDPYLEQFGGEKRQVEFVKSMAKVRYLKIGRNEAIDLYVMNIAALRALGRTFRETLGRQKPAAKVPPLDDPPEIAAPSPHPVPVQRPKAAPRTGWLNRWKR